MYFIYSFLAGLIPWIFFLLLLTNSVTSSIPFILGLGVGMVICWPVLCRRRFGWREKTYKRYFERTGVEFDRWKLLFGQARLWRKITLALGAFFFIVGALRPAFAYAVGLETDLDNGLRTFVFLYAIEFVFIVIREPSILLRIIKPCDEIYGKNNPMNPMHPLHHVHPMNPMNMLDL